ncbi:MAG: NAD-dependent epimerase/dehydratase family protein [Anaerolineales bacterium]|nr:NAD-dependent epimerase/dehydratase family protein [Anaerolineales bacterium]
MTRVCVTGANGHVGANVVRSLLQRRHEVVPFVRRTSDLQGIVLCPNGILGPYDYAITQTTELLRGWVNGTAVTNHGGVGFVDVRDVADVHAQAVSKGEPGKRYILAGENLTVQQWGKLVTRFTGIKPPMTQEPVRPAPGSWVA